MRPEPSVHLANNLAGACDGMDQSVGGINDVMDVLELLGGESFIPGPNEHVASHISEERNSRQAPPNDLSLFSHLDRLPPLVSSSTCASPRSTSPPPPKRRAAMTTPRWSVSREQKQLLEEFFKEVPMPSRAARKALSEQLGVTMQQIKVWFRNQRQRVRLAQRKVDADQ